MNRFGGTPIVREEDTTLRLEVTQNGEFLDGVPPQTVYFAGYPSVERSEAESTVTVTIPTVDDDVFEGDGYIEFALFETSDGSDINFEIDPGV